MPEHFTDDPRPHLRHSCSHSGRCGAVGGQSQAAVATPMLAILIKIEAWRSLAVKPGSTLAIIIAPSVVVG